MASPRQIEANRLNASKSTGPRTLRGKAAARFNALKTGIDAAHQFIPGEDPMDLRALTSACYKRWLPSLPEECALIDCLIHDEWQLRRLRRAEAALWKHVEYDYDRWDGRKTNSKMGSVVDRGGAAFSRLQWRYDSTQRSFHRNLAMLTALSREAAEIAASAPPDSEPETEPAAVPEPAEAEPVKPAPDPSKVRALEAALYASIFMRQEGAEPPVIYLTPPPPGDPAEELVVPLPALPPATDLAWEPAEEPVTPQPAPPPATGPAGEPATPLPATDGQQIGFVPQPPPEAQPGDPPSSSEPPELVAEVPCSPAGNEPGRVLDPPVSHTGPESSPPQDPQRQN